MTKTGFRQQEVPPPTAIGSGWSLGVTTAVRASRTKVYHFYPGNERQSVCTRRYLRWRKPQPIPQLSREAEYCASCEAWIKKNPNGSRRRAA